MRYLVAVFVQGRLPVTTQLPYSGGVVWTRIDSAQTSAGYKCNRAAADQIQSGSLCVIPAVVIFTFWFNVNYLVFVI